MPPVFAYRSVPAALVALTLAMAAAPSHAQDSGDALTRALINKVAPGLMPPTSITRNTSTTAPLPTAPLVPPQIVNKIPQPGGPGAAAPRPGGEAPAISAVRSTERRHGGGSAGGMQGGGSFGGGGRGISASQVLSKPGQTVPPPAKAGEEAKMPSKVPHRFAAAAEVSHDRLLPRLPMAKSKSNFEPAQPAEARPMPSAPAIP